MADNDPTIENELRETFARHETSLPDERAVRAGILDGVAEARARRRSVWAVVAAVAVIAVLAAPAALMRLGPFEPLLAPPAAAPSQTPVGALNFLLLGLDSGEGEVRRSDAVLVVHIDATHRSGTVLSIPRDLALDVPGHGKAKLDAAYPFGGTRLASQTVSNLTGLTFNGMAVVDYDALVAVTDALGGVDMCVEQRVVSLHLGVDRSGQVGAYKPGLKPQVYEQGCQHFAGWQAIDYLRQRFGLVNGALDRDANLRQYLLAVAKRLADQNVDPAGALALIAAAGPGLSVDTGHVGAADLYRTLREVDLGRLRSVGVPTVPRADQSLGATEVLGPRAPTLFAAVRTDTVDEWLAGG